MPMTGQRRKVRASDVSDTSTGRMRTTMTLAMLLAPPAPALSFRLDMSYARAATRRPVAQSCLLTPRASASSYAPKALLEVLDELGPLEILED